MLYILLNTYGLWKITFIKRHVPNLFLKIIDRPTPEKVTK